MDANKLLSALLQAISRKKTSTTQIAAQKAEKVAPTPSGVINV